jgi:hypothetical protein
MVAFNGVIGGITGGVGSAFSGAGIATQVAVGAGIGGGGSVAQQEVFTGHVDWGQVALSTGVGGVGAGAGSLLSKLAAAREVNAFPRTEVVTGNEPLALPRGRPTLTQNALEHIVVRHWATSDAANAGKFTSETTARSLKAMIEDTVENGAFRPNVGNRPGWIYEHDFGSKIGVDIAGSGTASLRVVLRSDNTVITAFPFSP